ncbi:MAG: type II toxin-antitoxin system RelE/ParE family toxin [Roseovarius sp.]|uniref:type II toxin-antitoxin system RelE/ParE family toxin n=1 Tax=Roseovarius sp. TaxID=1486281 RepID=UPI0032ED1BB6
MRRLRYSRKALRDLRDNWTYSADRWGRPQANRYVEAIRAVIGALPEGRAVTSSAEDVWPGTRRARSGRHVIYFRETEEAVEVIRVLHQRMDAGRWV